MIRLLDFIFALGALILSFPLLAILTLIGCFDTGSPIFIQERVGRFKRPFNLFKLRTMSVGTASVASHLASRDSITKFGGFLRKAKLDELPQLLNVLLGDMSLVGPRPNLFNQRDLIAKRDALGVCAARPGITGLAQFSRIDMSRPELLARTDAEMISSLTLGRYFGYLFQAVTGKGGGDRVSKKQ